MWIKRQLLLPIQFPSVLFSTTGFIEDRRNNELTHLKLFAVKWFFQSNVSLRVSSMINYEAILGNFTNGKESDCAFIKTQFIDSGSLRKNLRNHILLISFGLSLGLLHHLIIFVFSSCQKLGIIFVKTSHHAEIIQVVFILIHFLQE